MNRLLVAAAAAGSIALSGLVLAAPASATGSIVDNGNGSVTINTGGNWVYFCPPATAAGSCTGSTVGVYYGNDGTYQAGSSVNSGAATLPAGSYMVVTRVAGSGTEIDHLALVIGTPSSDPGTAPSVGPASVHQGLPMPASGSCADITDAAYAWGTGLTGGWAKSWQLWINPAEGKGGWACTRTLVHTGNAWTIQA